MTLSARSGVPPVASRRLRSCRGDRTDRRTDDWEARGWEAEDWEAEDWEASEGADGSDAMGSGIRARRGRSAATCGRSKVHGRRPAARDSERRATHPVCVHDVWVRTSWACDDAGARPRAAAGGARARARSPRCARLLSPGFLNSGFLSSGFLGAGPVSPAAESVATRARECAEMLHRPVQRVGALRRPSRATNRRRARGGA